MGDFFIALLRALIGILLELVFYLTARWVFPLISVGRIQVEPRTGSAKGRTISTASTASARPIVLGAGWGTFFGVLFWGVAIVVAIVLYRIF